MAVWGSCGFALFAEKFCVTLGICVTGKLICVSQTICEFMSVGFEVKFIGENNGRHFPIK